MNLFETRYQDGARLDLDGLAVRLSVNRRARRVSLRIDGVRREAVAVAPSLRTLTDAVAFAHERRPWIAERLAALPAVHAIGAAETLRVFGEAWRLVPDGRRPRLLAGGEVSARLTGCGAGEVDGQLVARVVKREALRVFTERAEAHCRGLAIVVPPIAISEARSRWGSCRAARGGETARIRLSWRLALAPFAVADYVVAHECAHLVEANHGPRFWALVGRLVGEARPHRAWLRAEGGRLHAYEFRGLA